MASAKFLKLISSMRGIMVLYKMDPPLPSYDGSLSQPYVILSSIDNEFSKECYIFFASNEEGDITDLTEMPGSTSHTTNHAEVLTALGYTIEV